MKKVLQSPEDIYETKLAREEALYISNTMSEPRMASLYNVAAETRKQPFFTNTDFYIVLVPTHERTAEMKPEDFIFVRRSCPTPGYNQNVFKYHKEHGNIEFLWSIPRKSIYWDMYNNRVKYLQNPKLKSRTAFVCMMESKELEKWVAKENKEDPKAEKAIIKINKPSAYA
jgi:hypothetical protein